ncbi:MAG: hypothetical protein V1789_11800 [PVC group bacterium]
MQGGFIDFAEDSWSPNGKILIVQIPNEACYLIDISRQESKVKELAHNYEDVIKWSPDSKYYIAIVRKYIVSDRTAKPPIEHSLTIEHSLILSSSEGKQIKHIFKTEWHSYLTDGYRDSKSVSWLPDSHGFITYTDDKEVAKIMLDKEEFETIRSNNHTVVIDNINISPEGNRLIYSVIDRDNMECRLIVIDLKSNTILAEKIVGEVVERVIRYEGEIDEIIWLSNDMVAILREEKLYNVHVPSMQMELVLEGITGISYAEDLRLMTAGAYKKIYTIDYAHNGKVDLIYTR